MRVLITGAKGQLGRDLVLRFAPEGELLPVDLPELDITDAAALSTVVAQFRPEAIINAAAYTDVEAAEDHAGDAYKINEGGAAIVAKVAADRGIPVLHYSTDFVFDGEKKSPYEPGDVISPLNVYGRSKAAGEVAVAAANANHFIIRTAWLYGPYGNNFVEKIMKAAQERSELHVVEDEVGSPTHTWDLAEATVALLKTDAFGIYHAVNAGECTRFDFARTILRMAKIPTPVRPCQSGQFPMKARRPAYSVLSNERLEWATGCQMPSWEDALQHYLQRRRDL